MIEPSSPSAVETARRLVGLRYTEHEVALRTRAIYEMVLRHSPRITTGNFTSAASSDLALLFDLYDESFFAGAARQLVQASGAPLIFGLSPRLTRSAGLTKRFSPARPEAARPLRQAGTRSRCPRRCCSRPSRTWNAPSASMASSAKIGWRRPSASSSMRCCT